MSWASGILKNSVSPFGIHQTLAKTVLQGKRSEASRGAGRASDRSPVHLPRLSPLLHQPPSYGARQQRHQHSTPHYDARAAEGRARRANVAQKHRSGPFSFDTQVIKAILRELKIIGYHQSNDGEIEAALARRDTKQSSDTPPTCL